MEFIFTCGIYFFTQPFFHFPRPLAICRRKAPQNPQNPSSEIWGRPVLFSPKVTYTFFSPQGRTIQVLSPSCQRQDCTEPERSKHLYRLYHRRDFTYILWTFALGSICHFLYEFSDYNPFLALIVPVNESVWEHLKLVFFPVLFLAIAEYYLRRPNPSMLFASRFVGVIFAMTAITVLFYIYTFITGRSILLLDILIYFAGICLCYIASSNLFPRFRRADPMKVFFCWFLSALLFFFFSCCPPEIGLFLPPQ